MSKVKKLKNKTRTLYVKNENLWNRAQKKSGGLNWSTLVETCLEIYCDAKNPKMLSSGIYQVK